MNYFDRFDELQADLDNPLGSHWFANAPSGEVQMAPPVARAARPCAPAAPTRATPKPAATSAAAKPAKGYADGLMAGRTEMLKTISAVVMKAEGKERQAMISLETNPTMSAGWHLSRLAKTCSDSELRERIAANRQAKITAGWDKVLSEMLKSGL